MRVLMAVVSAGAIGWAGVAGAARQHPEAHYQARWCTAQSGTAEVVLDDGTRADCVTATHAVEVDFGDNWAEALGQSLHYASYTGRRAGIVLILESPRDRRFWSRLTQTIAHFQLPIDTWQAGAAAGLGGESSAPASLPGADPG